YAANPLDPLGRPHVYTHWWLHLRDLGLTRAHNVWVGFALGGAFFAMAVARLRPASGGQLVWYLALLGSPPVILALNRANNDLVVFLLLAAVVPCLLSPQRWVRMAAVVPIAIATGLKFYPAAAAFVLLYGDGSREVRGRLLLAGLVLAVVGVDLIPDLKRFGGFGFKAGGLTSFGSANLLEFFGVHGLPALLTGVAFTASVMAVCWRLKLFSGWTIAPGDRAAWLSFVLGAVLLTACFFTGTNFAYRWIFALWLAPLLWTLPRDPRAPVAVRRWATVTAGLLIVVIWADPLASSALYAVHKSLPPGTVVRWANKFILLEQPLVWAFFAGLIGLLAHFARDGWRILRPVGDASRPGWTPTTLRQ
ncbi:MAG: hypothetical protein ABIR80_08160, partial [Opitutaceae bacterium]